jgi:sec-independent protein translocase protein TatB
VGFNLGPEKLILLFVLALIVLGPSRLPDAARTVGRVVGELRRMSGSFQKEVQEALSDPKDALTAAVGDLRNELGDFRSGFDEVKGGFGEVRNFGLSSTSETAPVGGAPGWSPEPPPPVPSAPVPLPPSPDDPSLN